MEKGERGRSLTNDHKIDVLHEHVHEILSLIKAMEAKMSQEMDDLKAAVAKMRGTVDSTKLLIQGLRQQIIDAGTDPAALKQITDDLTAEEADLAAAVAAPGGGP